MLAQHEKREAVEAAEGFEAEGAAAARAAPSDAGRDAVTREAWADTKGAHVKLFLPQKTLESWMLDEKADLENGRLVLRPEDSSFPAVPGVHFVKLVTGDDVKHLAGRVKTEQQVLAMAGELTEDTALLGDTAYEIVRGFVTEVAAPATQKEEPPKKPGAPEADLLAAFILDKL